MESKDDPMIRDRKSLSMAGWSVLPYFIGSILMVPVWLIILLPFTLLVKLCMLPFSGKKTKKTEQALPNVKEGEQKDLSDRTYDLVLFGATGFTGKLAAEYLAKNYGKKIAWALAGRRKEALEAVRTELTKINSDLKDLPLIIADVSKVESLHALINDTRVVITTVGPYMRYGTPIVDLCAKYGTGYCDITGETDWVREMVDKYDDIAKKTKANIVHFCGHDCVPWDLMTFMVAKKLKEKGEDLVEIRFYDELRGAFSGGTLETAVNALSSRSKYTAKLGFDPLVKTRDGKKSDARFTMANQNILAYSKQRKAWVGPFFMASVMGNAIRRSNAVNGYSNKFLYSESLVYPGFMAGFVTFFGNILFGTVFVNPVLFWVARKFFLPKPGEGPSKEDMDAGFLKLIAFAKGDKGSRIKGTMYFPTDPGYRDTARMLVESGLTLVFESDKLQVQGGVGTPATALQELLLQRLEQTGTYFSIEEI